MLFYFLKIRFNYTHFLDGFTTILIANDIEGPIMLKGNLLYIYNMLESVGSSLFCVCMFCVVFLLDTDFISQGGSWGFGTEELNFIDHDIFIRLLCPC